MPRQKAHQNGQPMPGGKRAALYPRVSSKGQEEDGTSLESQEQRCRYYAASKGYVVDDQHVYREVHTGTELWERPKLTALREAIRRREIDVLVVYAIDRLSRDPVHLGVLLTEADHAGVAVEFVSEPLDDSPEGQLIRFVRGYAAKVEHEKIRERTIRGRQARAAAGKLLPGRSALYGYCWNAERTAYLPDSATSAIVRQIFTWAASGWTMRAIAARLTADGLSTPSGRSAYWKLPTLQWILHHPAYTGAAVANRHAIVKDRQRGTTRVLVRPKGEQFALPAGTIPAIIDQATFDTVQQRLTRNKSFAVRNAKHPEEALLRAGYARCGYCGYSMWVQGSSKNRGGVYRCAKSSYVGYGGCACPNISTNVLDAAVWTRISALLAHPELIAAELERMQQQDPSTADLEAVERSLSAVVRQQRNYVENLGKVQGAAADLIAEKINALEAQRAQHATEREAILTRRAVWERAKDRVGDMQQWCRTVATNLKTLTYQDKRTALDIFNVTVTVWRADHTPRYKIDSNIPLNGVVVNETRWGFIHNNAVYFSWTDADPLPLEPALATR
jgi:site-specific DNA recombinase